MQKVIDFLAELRENNNKAWFDANKGRYKAVQAAVDELAAELIVAIASFDESVTGLSPKDCTYRIYRDIRFSKDKTPYKTHIGIYVCPGGKKSGNAGYYFHLEPEGSETANGEVAGGGSVEGEATTGCLISAGLYMPDPAALRSVREDIAYNGDSFLAALGEAVGFSLMGESLTRVPSGFPADSPMAGYLKRKDISLYKRVSMDFINAPNLAERVAAEFSKTASLVRWLNRAVRYAREEK